MAPGQGALRIGLLNNMPRKAAGTTERQIAALLAQSGRQVRLRCFTLGLPAGEDPGGSYEKLDRLLDSELDGLIVTGAVPVANSVQEEPAWPGLARVVDWASRNTVSTIWSCLAAQAAVYRLDGVARDKLPQKLSGLFTCDVAGSHPVLAEMPPRWSVPHSRYNDLAVTQLARNDYTILSHGPRIGADLFSKRVERSDFLFLQGHPEYAADALSLEYRRDVRQFIRGERAGHPALPDGYFDKDTASELGRLKDHTLARPSPAMLPALDQLIAEASLPNWQHSAMALFRGWLAMIAVQRADLPCPA